MIVNLWKVAIKEEQYVHRKKWAIARNANYTRLVTRNVYK